MAGARLAGRLHFKKNNNNKRLKWQEKIAAVEVRAESGSHTHTSLPTDVGNLRQQQQQAGVCGVGEAGGIVEFLGLKIVLKATMQATWLDLVCSVFSKQKTCGPQ